MADIFLQTLPFFALIGLGWGAAATRFFPPEASAFLTKFVFYFALSAMLFRFSANLTLEEILDWQMIQAYLWPTLAVYLLTTAVALLRRRGTAEAAVEAQCSAIGNTGFLGLPMLGLLMGEGAIAVLVLMLAIDLIVFGSLIVILITGSRDGRMSPRIVGTVAGGLLRNPMIVSITLGLLWSGTGGALPAPVNTFLVTLGAAATPCALFAIGASLADKSAERIAVAAWLSFGKLVLHPAAVAVAVFWVFDVDPYVASVMVAGASLPVAGNIYILAKHYNVAPQRVSASILLSTVVSVVTVSLVIGWVTGF